MSDYGLGICLRGMTLRNICEAMGSIPQTDKN